MNVQMRNFKEAISEGAEVIALADNKGWIMVARTNKDQRNYILRSARREFRIFRTLDALINVARELDIKSVNVCTDPPTGG